MNREARTSGFRRGLNDVLALPRRYAVQQSKKNSLEYLTDEDGNHKLWQYIGNNQRTLPNVSIVRRPQGKVLLLFRKIMYFGV
jgi:hypothetical protein